MNDIIINTALAMALCIGTKLPVVGKVQACCHVVNNTLSCSAERVPPSQP